MSRTRKARLLPVALLAEGVDRNCYPWHCWGLHPGSPSSRRAWIEIHAHVKQMRLEKVALLAEGVDRNVSVVFGIMDGIGRPPRGGRG